MEKLKFMFQVFTAIVALPVIVTVELNHNNKGLQADTAIVTKKIAATEGFYLNNTGKPARLYVK